MNPNSIIFIIEILKGLLTPLIACLTVYIAFQQWKTNKQRLKLDLYDRRIRIYQEVKKIIRSIVRSGVAFNADEILDFRHSVFDAHFLFGEEVIKYLDEIDSRANNLCYYVIQTSDRDNDKIKTDEYQKIVDDRYKELKWLTDQFRLSKNKFDKYLNLSK